MNERPQEARADEQENIFEQIITQGLEKINGPAQEAAAKEAPSEAPPPAPEQDSGSEATPPAGRKNRRSAVYLYLMVLFGAAFLLLLLAYFVQQRSNESAISNLRDFMNLSRTDLMNQIKALEEEKAELVSELTRLNRELARQEQRYEEMSQEVADLANNYYFAQSELYSWETYWALEEYYQMGNYGTCAAILIAQLQSPYVFHPPNGADRRYEEIVKAVVRAGFLDENFEEHPEEYSDLLNAYTTP